MTKILTSLLLALVAVSGTGRTDVGINGVFGAGKTRAISLILAAAAHMCDAEILMVAKDNVAMRAVAEYLNMLLPTNDMSPRRRVRRFCGGEELSRQEKQAYSFDVHPDRRDSVWPESQVCLLTTGVLESMRRNSRPWNSDLLQKICVAF